MTRQLRLIAASLLLSVLAAGTASAQQDTLQVSSRYTSHVIFSTDVTYADMSNSQVITAKVVEQNKNMIAVRARSVFSEPCSISALESNGRMWTFIVVYRDSPDELIVDTREQRRRPQQQAEPAPSSSYQSRQPQAQSAPRESYANDDSRQRSSYSARDGRRAQREQEIAEAERQRQAEEREKAGRKAQKKADRQARREQYAQEYGEYDGGGSVFSSGKSSGKASKKASKDSYDSSSRSSRDDAYSGSYGDSYAPSSSRASNVSTWKQGDAPMLSDVAGMPRKLYHIGTSGYGVDVQVENIYSYSDITYMVISVENGSGISWDVTDATFVIESRRQTKRTVSYDQTVFPKSRYGTLGAGPGGAGRIVYSFDKMTLSEDQVLKVYLYESSGQRNLVMTVSPDDINRAKSLADVRR